MPNNRNRFTKGGGGSAANAVTGPGSSTDNAISRWDGAGGTTIQDSAITVSDLAAGAVTLATTAGNALTIKNTNPAATTGASVAGDAIALTAGDAVASTDTAGAAAGGAVTITSGAAARFTSGNANGGNINLVTGTGIGTGTAGQVLIPDGTAAVPGLAFTSEGDVGIYRAGNNAIGFAEGGGVVFQLNGSQAVFTTMTTYGMRRSVTASTAGSGAPNVLASTSTWRVYTNEGTTAENYHTLPSASTGDQFTFIVQDSDGIRITAAAGDTIRPIAGTAASAAAGFIRCATQGAFITLIAINATEWIAIGSAGTWTIDV